MGCGPRNRLERSAGHDSIRGGRGPLGSLPGDFLGLLPGELPSPPRGSQGQVAKEPLGQIGELGLRREKLAQCLLVNSGTDPAGTLTPTPEGVLISHRSWPVGAQRLFGGGGEGRDEPDQAFMPSDMPFSRITGGALKAAPCPPSRGAGILPAHPLIPRSGQGAGHDTHAGYRGPEILPVL